MAFDLEAMLRALRDVEFILVGGVPGIAGGRDQRRSVRGVEGRPS
jgi:hypothetical protein